jgi:hypothetical protein
MSRVRLLNNPADHVKAIKLALVALIVCFPCFAPAFNRTAAQSTPPPQI